MTNILKQRIEAKRQILLQKEEQLQNSLGNFLELLQPSSMLKAATSNLLKSTMTPSGIVKNGLSLVTSYLASKPIFQKENLLTRVIGMFGIKNLVDGLIDGKK